MSDQAIAYWRIISPTSIYTRRYETRDAAEHIRLMLPDPDSHHLRAYNGVGKVVIDDGPSPEGTVP